MGTSTCRCGCTVRLDGSAHAIVAALAIDDVDAALQAGLLASEACPGCTEACRAMVLTARDARLVALAARDRFRAREARLARRKEQRLQRMPPTRDAAPAHTAAASSLPPAAAAALARARDKAASRQSP